jgi:poly[(R)-3-hydroxyalkanoate] polymerase subunit PhaC
MADKPCEDERLVEEPGWPALVERSRRLAEQWRQQPVDTSLSVLDPQRIFDMFVQVSEAVFADTGRLVQAQERLRQDFLTLHDTLRRSLQGEDVKPVVTPDPGDRRFKDDAWTNDPIFNGIKQYYLLTARWLEDVVADAHGLNAKTHEQALFYLRQMISAMAPTNFIPTNPKVLRAVKETEGDNLRRGFKLLLDDLERGKGRLRISLTDLSAFELGRDLATTPGKVVMQNDLAQLIQYEPLSPRVRRRPLLIVPPWINKYYILDLQPDNSFIRWAVAEGHTVFVISWVNPDERLSHKSFDDYLKEGPLAALDAIAAATGEPEVNAVGYCIGGTLLACTLAHLAAKGRQCIRSATFLTTMVDFADPGEIGVFIDEEQVKGIEKHIAEKGYLAGDTMAQVFSLLRENDLIWSPYVNSYLLGKAPPPFDILFWNADSTRMPGMMHRFYIREMYMNNRLIEPGALTLAGTPIDLGRVTVPVYMLSTREDHIAPWRSTFAATRLYKGPLRFVLAGSGHIAGVINPPSSRRYGYSTNSRRTTSPETWLKRAKDVGGSWWPDWGRWVARHGGGLTEARTPGSGGLPVLEDAPGSYVRMRHDG